MNSFNSLLVLIKNSSCLNDVLLKFNLGLCLEKRLIPDFDSPYIYEYPHGESMN